ncbi:MAG: hypothetical protein K5694_00570 [Bacilli bacterium]|nr:hypothetical protein [Bacilli bacterium]
MRTYKIIVDSLTTIQDKSGKWDFLRESTTWDDISVPFCPRYSKDEMVFVGFDETRFKATVKFQGKDHTIYFGNNYSNNISSTNVHPASGRDVNYYLKIKEEIVDPVELDDKELLVEEDAKFGGSYAPKDYSEKCTLKIVEGNRYELPGSKNTLEIMSIDGGCVTIRLGYRLDIAKMYVIKDGEPIIIEKKESSGRNEDFSSHDETIKITLIEKR